MWYRHRGHWRGRRIFIFPFILFLFMFSGMHHFVFAPILVVGTIVIASVFIAKLLTASSNPRPYQPYQRQTQYYQRPHEYQLPYYRGEQEYQPYQQGYQVAEPVHTEAYKEGGQQYQYPEQEHYQEYEQPQAQYPEQTPPIQQ